MRSVVMLLSIICALSAHATRANNTVRRLQIEDYPQLPPNVAVVLRSRACTIPQPSQSAPPRNVIVGDFFQKGQTAWAVLCSSANQSMILVFRNRSDHNPSEIAKSEDSRFIIETWQGGKLYSREISAADRRFILRHYSAYGGLKPPQIDHSGIDDAFLEKASIIWYWYRGRWFQLQGAD